MTTKNFLMASLLAGGLLAVAAAVGCAKPTTGGTSGTGAGGGDTCATAAKGECENVTSPGKVLAGVTLPPLAPGFRIASGKCVEEDYVPAVGEILVPAGNCQVAYTKGLIPKTYKARADATTCAELRGSDCPDATPVAILMPAVATKNMCVKNTSTAPGADPCMDAPTSATGITAPSCAAVNLDDSYKALGTIDDKIAACESAKIGTGATAAVKTGDDACIVSKMGTENTAVCVRAGDNRADAGAAFLAAVTSCADLETCAIPPGIVTDGLVTNGVTSATPGAVADSTGATPKYGLVCIGGTGGTCTPALKQNGTKACKPVATGAAFKNALTSICGKIGLSTVTTAGIAKVAAGKKCEDIRIVGIDEPLCGAADDTSGLCTAPAAAPPTASNWICAFKGSWVVAPPTDTVQWVLVRGVSDDTQCAGPISLPLGLISNVTGTKIASTGPDGCSAQ